MLLAFFLHTLIRSMMSSCCLIRLAQPFATRDNRVMIFSKIPFLQSQFTMKPICDLISQPNFKLF